jgi:hypothetical protein
MTMIEMIVPNNRKNTWLYYETGFEQLHPNREIIDWFAEQGLKYNRDWFCVKDRTREPSVMLLDQVKYTFRLPSEDILMLFLLRWS